MCQQCKNVDGKECQRKYKLEYNARKQLWRKTHPEEDKARRVKEREQLYSDTGRLEKRRDAGKRKRRMFREFALRMYGDHQCACCKEHRYEFLAIDHMNNDGGKHRKSMKGYSSKFIKWLIDDYREGFQVLCHNCNCARGFYGYCPHKKESG